MALAESIASKMPADFPREISRYIYYFIKEEEGTVEGVLNSLNYKPSPLPSGGLEVPLLLRMTLLA